MVRKRVTKQINSMEKILQCLDEGQMLSAPDHSDNSELVFPVEDTTEYAVDGKYYTAFEELINKNKTELLRKIYIKEPHTGGAWYIIAKTNTAALEWEATPEIKPDIEGDEFDEE